MPRVSRKRINKNITEEIKDNFASLISLLSTKADIENFFIDFLTEEEKTMLAKRLMLHLMLENNYKTVQIQSVLGVSRETIRAHKNIWERGGPAYKKILVKIARREKMKEFWKKLEKALKPLELALNAKSNMKARAKFASGGLGLVN